MKICFLVVIYDKNFSESTTIKSLLNINKKNFYLCIVNNGPHSIDSLDIRSCQNINFRFLEYLENKPLSHIYNDFIDYYHDADRFIILDDDSILKETYINRVFSENICDFDLELPKILNASNKIYYPLKNWIPISQNETVLDYKEDVIFSIGSGLVITKDLVTKFRDKKIEIFNKSFALYGVDFSFFWEINKKDFGNIKITSQSEIMHDMSLHGEISDFKLNELYINFALQMRHYPSKVNFKNSIYSLIQTIKKRKIKLFISMIKCYINAKHPRC